MRSQKHGLDPCRLIFLEAASAAYPIQRVSPAGSPYKPVAPVERRLSPPAAAEEPMPGATTRSRHATIEALARGKSKSGSKKKRQAAKRKEARSAASASVGGSEVADAPTPPSETMADAKSAPDEETGRTEDVKEVKATHEDGTLPGRC